MGDTATAPQETPRVYLDTEFTKFARPQLISPAWVAESRQEFYGESTDFEKVQCSDFVLENVLPLLEGGDVAASLNDLRSELIGWLATLPSPAEMISDFDGDIELLLKLRRIGGTETGRYNIAELTVLDNEFVKSESFNSALGDYFDNVDSRRHHALVDARALISAHAAIKNRVVTTSNVIYAAHDCKRSLNIRGKSNAIVNRKRRF